MQKIKKILQGKKKETINMLEEFLTKRKNKKWLLLPPTIICVALIIYTFFRIYFHWQILSFVLPLYIVCAAFTIITAGLILYFEGKRELKKIYDDTKQSGSNY